MAPSRKRILAGIARLPENLRRAALQALSEEVKTPNTFHSFSKAEPVSQAGSDLLREALVRYEWGSKLVEKWGPPPEPVKGAAALIWGYRAGFSSWGRTARKGPGGRRTSS